MRDLDEAFDSTDVIRYTPPRKRETEPVDASMVMRTVFDDSELEAVLAQLDAETDHKGDRV